LFVLPGVLVSCASPSVNALRAAKEWSADNCGQWRRSHVGLSSASLSAKTMASALLISVP